MSDKPVVVADPWQELRRYTPARIALGRSGISLPTAPHLAFQLAHAQARDAVHHPFDLGSTAASIEALGLSTLHVRSAASDRSTYLRRPDLGRRLDDASATGLRREGEVQPVGSLQPWGASAGMRIEPSAEPAIDPSTDPPTGPSFAPTIDPAFDLVIVVADGLSARAVERHAAPFVACLLGLLRSDPTAWHIGPVVLVREGRVAIGDEIGERIRADLVLVLIGERPGLSAPDSMGLYLTWAPRVGRHDAERNCISNVRPEGLAIEVAAVMARSLMRAARERRLTGVRLKEDSTSVAMLPRTPVDPADAVTDRSLPGPGR